MELYDESAFIDRVAFEVGGDRPLFWIVGSPISYEPNRHIGVPAVAEIIELIRDEFRDDVGGCSRLDEHLPSAANQYQAAFSYLTGHKGQQAANDVVRRAVLQAYRGPKPNQMGDDTALKAAERDSRGWQLPAAVLALGSLVAVRAGRARTGVFTTNFDPLLEIALRLSGSSPLTSAFHRDGNPGIVHTDQPQVVHLHGYWIGSDTLHAPHQLRQDRPRLRAALATALRNSVVVVAGYSGWDDIVTSVLREVLDEDNSFPDVVWAFHESERQDIERRYSAVLADLAPGIARNRVTCYAGIDVHGAFPEVASRARPRASDQKLLPGATSYVDAFASTQRLRTSDSIPTVDLFVGRAVEMKALLSTSANVIAISGLGGQGKSILAARFMEVYAERWRNQKRLKLDWRDCKEEGNTAHLSICLFLEIVSGGNLLAEHLARASAEELASVFVDVVRPISGVLVLDNVDTYVDVENGRYTGIINSILSRHLGSSSDLKIVLTSRPEVRLGHANFFPLHIDGLERDATRALYQHKSASLLTEHQLDRLTGVTRGHPLGVVLLAAQRLSSERSFEEILESAAASNADLSRGILRSTWKVLKNEDQSVLRSLAELERPEFENELEGVTGIRYNRLSKSLRRLRDMNLVLTRVDRAGKHLIDLHPLVRQFIRREYQKNERESFIGRILVFYDQKLQPFRTRIADEISSNSLNLWIHKIEILLNKGSWSEASNELTLITKQLERHGLFEEQIRLGVKILAEGDWTVLLSQGKIFRKLFASLMHSMTYFGLHEEIERWSQVYESYSTKGGADAIVIAASRAFDAWFRRDFERALALAQDARERRAMVDVALDNEPSHIYALALRDSGQVDDGLVELLEGLTLDEALSGEEGKSGPYYGNVGRCLQLLGRYEEALIAFRHCYKAFAKNSDEGVNSGWLRHWVGQCYEKKGQSSAAMACYVAAVAVWKSSSPVLERVAVASVRDLRSAAPSIEDIPAWKAERSFRELMR